MTGRPGKQETWRFINSGYLDGATNMAIDVALAQCMTSESRYPVLRIYGWDPPAISLGYHQNTDDIDLERCKKDNVDVVVRPTGGRAILHADELTYAVVIPQYSRYYDPQVSRVYGIISQCLVEGLNQLEYPVEFERAAFTPRDFNRGELSTMCYASTVQHEISHQGRKLVGSAQRRLNGVVLQHGSVLIGRKHLDITDYLTKQDEKGRERVKSFMMKKTTCLKDIKNSNGTTFRDLTLAIKNGFEKRLDVKFLETELTPRELACVRDLKTRK